MILGYNGAIVKGLLSRSTLRRSSDQGEESSLLSHYLNEDFFFQQQIQSTDVQKGPFIFYKTTVPRETGHLKLQLQPRDSKRSNFAVQVSYTMLSKMTKICPMKSQCCALYKRIHECIMRGENEPQKAHWRNPLGKRKLFRIDEDTIHNNSGKGNFFFSLHLKSML